MENNTINLISDDENSEDHTNFINDNTVISETIEIFSDGLEEGNQVSDDESKPMSVEPEVVDTDKPEVALPESPSFDESKLTPQELMRRRMACAAEQRLKRSLNNVEDVPPTEDKKELNEVIEKANEQINLSDDDEIVITTSNILHPNKRTKTISTDSITIEDDHLSIQPTIEKHLIDTCKSDTTSRIRMISNPSYCNEFHVDADRDSVSLSDLVGSKKLRKTYQFNMLIDFDYLQNFVTNKNCEYVLVCKNDDDHLHIQPTSYNRFNVKVIDVSDKLPKFGTHHTKMMVNFYDDKTCQIVVHTMNMTQADHVMQTQMCWVSPPLKMHSNPQNWLDFNTSNISITKDTGTVFKRDFIAYLLTYNKDGVNKLIDEIGKYDFSPIDVVFVASSPGNYNYENWEKLTAPNAKPMFGYGRLWQVIHMLKLECLHGKFIGQTSTIAGPCDNWKRNTFVHLLTSCVEKGFPMVKKADYSFNANARAHNKVEPIIIWPTVDEVLKSKAGPLSGIALHMSTSGKWAAYERQYNEIKQYFHKWTTHSDFPQKSKAGRSNLSPHVKTYTVTEDNFKTLKWFLMTSANISSQAWGKYKKYNLIDYDISSFEAGIFIAPELLRVSSNINNEKQVLVPTYGKDDASDVHLLSGNKFKIGMRLPYDTPLTKYSNTDEPWAQPESLKYFQ